VVNHFGVSPSGQTGLILGLVTIRFLLRGHPPSKFFG
jgi:hypothetical protein